ncbi:MAG: helix-turn-helix domain-containing protein [Candidatus Cryptobacteroides sp.]
MKENNHQGQAIAIVPKSEIDAIASSIEEVKELIRGKAKEEVGNEWLESSEARKLLGVSQKTWQTYRDTRALPFSQFGRKIYVRRSDIEDFLLSHSIKN